MASARSLAAMAAGPRALGEAIILFSTTVGMPSCFTAVPIGRASITMARAAHTPASLPPRSTHSPQCGLSGGAQMGSKNFHALSCASDLSRLLSLSLARARALCREPLILSPSLPCTSLSVSVVSDPRK
jgi:hypothetical protein